LPGATLAQAIDSETPGAQTVKKVVEASSRRSPSGFSFANTRVAAFHSGPPENQSQETGSEAKFERILEWKHFETALSEISPSSTEDGTLPELRKVRRRVKAYH
jgi:hypothetical protein